MRPIQGARFKSGCWIEGHQNPPISSQHVSLRRTCGETAARRQCHLQFFGDEKCVCRNCNAYDAVKHHVGHFVKKTAAQLPPALEGSAAACSARVQIGKHVTVCSSRELAQAAPSHRYMLLRKLGMACDTFSGSVVITLTVQAGDRQERGETYR